MDPITLEVNRQVRESKEWIRVTATSKDDPGQTFVSFDAPIESSAKYAIGTPVIVTITTPEENV